MDRLLFGICIQHSLSHLATNPALGKMKLGLPALDFVAKELEAVLDMNNPRFSADVAPHPVVSGFGQPLPLRLVPLLPIYR